MEPEVVLPTEYTYLALGDSYTIGQGVSEEDRWPNQLSQQLTEDGLTITQTNIIARTGWTTQNLLNAIEAEQPEQHDIVSLLIGVNNQFQRLAFDLYETEFDSLLNIALELSKDQKYVFVVSIPDYGVTPFGSSNSELIATELDQYNAYAEDRCKELDIPYINITEISREMGNNDGALASDKLHPSGIQYGKWVEVILPVVKDILKE